MRKAVAFSARGLFARGVMSSTKSRNIRRLFATGLVLLSAMLGVILCYSDTSAQPQTFGIKDAQGTFVPKVTVTFGKQDGKQEVTIKKYDPQAFRTLSLRLNPKNADLIRNVALLEIEWLNADGRPNKPMPFRGTKYDPQKKVFQDEMTRSAALRIIDKSKTNLFGRKNVAELFTIIVDDQTLVSSESALEGDRTVQLGAGRDVSINVNLNSVVFRENNLRTGVTLEADNRSGVDQIIGVQVPDKGLVYSGIVMKLEQTKVQPENREKFTVAPGSGIRIILIPEPDSAQLAQLNGKEVVINVYQGSKIRETIKLPIRVDPDLLAGGPDLTSRTSIREEEEPSARPASPRPRNESASPRQATAAAGPARAAYPAGWIWLWILQIFNLVLLLALGAYGIFFMLPRIQVLEDRLSKSEMFLHGSREAIREELEQIKRDLLEQYPKDNSPE